MTDKTANVDNSTFVEVDLDKAFDNNGKQESKESKGTNSANEQTVDFDVNSFLLDMDAELSPKKTEEKVETQEVVDQKTETEGIADKEIDPQATPLSEVEQLRAEVDTLKTRYSDSSKQGKKVPELEKKIADLEPKIRVYDQIVADPVLENMVVDYWNKGKQPSSDLKTELDLGEDFVFDSDEITKPGTDSYKVFNASVQKAAGQMVDKRFAELQQKNETEAKEQRIQAMKSEFVGKYGESALEEVETYMEDKQLGLEDIYKLMNFGERDKTIARNAATQQSEQVKKNQERDPSLATKKGAVIHNSDERNVMDALKEIDGGDFSF